MNDYTVALRIQFLPRRKLDLPYASKRHNVMIIDVHRLFLYLNLIAI